MATRGTQVYRFKAETKRLLDLMIHSLYSNKEIFLRELISNASDAVDRLRFEALANEALRGFEANPEIRLEADPEARTLTIHDSGIGMSREEVVDNLGTIARSGWQDLIEKMKAGQGDKVALEFIGQFGVGFYASFMVADTVKVVTRRAGEAEATVWESSGDGTFEVGSAERDKPGTSITLQLKPVDVENGLDDFTSEYVLSGIVKRYSDFVPYPVRMTVYREKEVEGEAATDQGPAVVAEVRTLNSMKALWRRPQSEVTDDEYDEFYRHICRDWSPPLERILQHAEGRLEYEALLFIPAKAPNELYYQAYQSGMQLFVRNVKIIEQCTDLLPRYLRFIRGVVDCADLPLNVSREMLQHSREIVQIRRALTKKVLDTLTQIRQNEPAKYLQLWGEYGRAIKEGVGADDDNRERITDLLLFQSSSDPAALTTLADYVTRMKPEQPEIYYVTGESRVIVENLPALEAFNARGYEVLFLVEPVDELLTQYLHEYGGKRLRSVVKGNIDLGGQEEKEEAKKEREEKEKTYAGLLDAMQKQLDEHVKQVRLSSRLTSSAACLVGAEHDYSPQLEKLLLKGKGGGPRQRRILEVNPKHPVLELLQRRFETNGEDPLIGEYAELLFGQGLLTEGSELPDPVKFSRQVANLMVSGCVLASG